MGEQLINFETAKLAKEKDFDWKVTNYFSKKEISHTCSINSNFFECECRQPTQSLLQKWLREVHDIDVIVNTLRNQGSKDYQIHISSLKETTKGEYYYKTYEEALEAGLQEALKLI